VLVPSSRILLWFLHLSVPRPLNSLPPLIGCCVPIDPAMSFLKKLRGGGSSEPPVPFSLTDDQPLPGGFDVEIAARAMVNDRIVPDFDTWFNDRREWRCPIVVIPSDLMDSTADQSPAPRYELVTRARGWEGGREYWLRGRENRSDVWATPLVADNMRNLVQGTIRRRQREREAAEAAARGPQPQEVRLSDISPGFGTHVIPGFSVGVPQLHRAHIITECTKAVIRRIPGGGDGTPEKFEVPVLVVIADGR